MLRDWKVQPIGGIFGDSAEGKKGPQRCFEKEFMGIVAKAESDPHRYYGKVWLSLTVKEYIMRTLIEGGRQTYVDGQTVLCGERLPSKSSM